MQFKCEVQSFPIIRRLCSPNEYEQVFRASKSSNKWFTVYSLKNSCSVSRLGIVASKKVMPKAVNRNLAKRIVREMFRTVIVHNNGIDVVVRVRMNICKDNATEGRRALFELFEYIQA